MPLDIKHHPYRILLISVMALALLYVAYKWVRHDFARNTVTVYASGYSDSGWKLVQKGMTTGTVYRLLGAPLDEGSCAGLGQPDKTGWFYSGKSTTGSPYYVYRIIVFDNDKVVSKETGVCGGR